MTLSNIGWLSILTSGATPSTLLNDLVAYWNFDQASGADEPDLAGGIGTLTPVFTDESPTSVSGPDSKLARQFGGSAFDGSTQSALTVSTGSPALPLTLNFWVFNPPFMDQGGGSLPMCFNEVSTWGPPCSIYFYAGTTYLQIHDDIGNYVAVWNPNTSYCDSTWHMFTIQVEADQTTVAYVDGVLATDFVLTDWSPHSTFDSSATAISPVDSASFGCPLYLGSLNAGDNSVGRFSMTGVWNRILTPSEITQLYNAGAGLYYTNL